MHTEDLWFRSCWSLSCFDRDTCVILKEIPAIVKYCSSKILNNAPYISDYLGYGYPYQYNSGPSAVPYCMSPKQRSPVPLVDFTASTMTFGPCVKGFERSNVRLELHKWQGEYMTVYLAS